MDDLLWGRGRMFFYVQHVIYADQNIIICSPSKKKESFEQTDGSHRSTDLLHSNRHLHLIYLYFCWPAHLILLKHPSLTRRLIVC